MADWQADRHLLEAALETVRERVQALLSESAPPSSSEGATPAIGLQEDEPEEHVLGPLLEALGTLSFLGEGKAAKALLAGLSPSGDISRMVIEFFSPILGSSLDEAAARILRLALDLEDAEDEERSVLEEEIVDTLALRDRIELCLEGARVLLGSDPPLSDEWTASIQAFDELLEHELWRLLPLGSRRAARCAWAAPPYRQRLWWWSRGCNLPHTALEDLGTAAEVIALFPQAREVLEHHIQAARSLHEQVGGTADSIGNPLPLRTYLLRQRHRGKDAPDQESLPPLLLAADAGEERVIWRSGNLVLSTDDRHLILDVESPAEPVEASPPRIEGGDTPPLIGRTVEGCKGRFVFPLNSPHFDRASAELAVYLDTGVRTIRIPFDSEP